MKKKRLKKTFKYILVILLIIVVSFGGYNIYKYYNNSNDFNETIDNDNINNDTEEVIEENKVYKLSLLATGDGLIHSVIYRTYYNDGVYDFSPALTYVKDIVSNYDIAYYNQETPTGDSSISYSGYPLFYTPSEYPQAMIDIGFNMVSLASNHSLDKGEAGILNTLQYFKTTDVLYSGMNESLEDNYIIMEKNNITYTMLSYTTLTNGLSTPSGKEYLVNIYDEESVKEDIEAVRDKVDVLIVAMHWGVEYSSTPNSEQTEIAEYLSSLGVDIIIGNHPHVLQPITTIGSTIVMYSLGNFISNQYGTDDYNKLIGFMATLDITKTVTPEGDVTITYDNLGGELIFTKYDGNPTTTAVHYNHQVIPFSMMSDDEYLTDYERLYEKYSSILESMGLDLDIAPLGSKTT